MIRPQPARACRGSKPRGDVGRCASPSCRTAPASIVRSASTIRPGGGPPVLATRMSAPPSFSVTAFAKDIDRRPCRPGRRRRNRHALPPPALIASTISAQLVLGAAGQQHVDALGGQRLARCPGRGPRLDDITSALFPFSPRSISPSPPVVSFEPRHQARQFVVIRSGQRRPRRTHLRRSDARRDAAGSPCGWRGRGRAAARSAPSAGTRRTDPRHRPRRLPCAGRPPAPAFRDRRSRSSRHRRRAAFPAAGTAPHCRSRIDRRGTSPVPLSARTRDSFVRPGQSSCFSMTICGWCAVRSEDRLDRELHAGCLRKILQADRHVRPECVADLREIALELGLGQQAGHAVPP